MITFHNDSFPNPAGLIEYAAKREGTIKLRPDNRLQVNRAWGDPKARLGALFQLTKGLSAIAMKANVEA